MLRRVEVGARVTTITDQTFQFCSRLKSISIPQNVGVEGYATFNQAMQLRVIAIQSITNVYRTFYQCTNLRAITGTGMMNYTDKYIISNTAVRQINFDMTAANQAQALERVHIKAVNGQVRDFSACRSLLEVTIPADATTFVAAAFQGDNALRRVTCLGNIASIPAQVFQRCYPLRFVDFTHCTAVPTLANVNAFDATHAQLEIRVPASLVTAWKAATNWSSLADHIVGV